MKTSKGHLERNGLDDNNVNNLDDSDARGRERTMEFESIDEMRLVPMPPPLTKGTVNLILKRNQNEEGKRTEPSSNQRGPFPRSKWN